MFQYFIKRARIKSHILGNKNQHYDNMKPSSYLKYYSNFDNDYIIGDEYKHIFDMNTAATTAKVPWLMSFMESPKYNKYLPNIFTGRISFAKHDLIHLLLSRGFNKLDEVAVIGATMGSTKKTGFFRGILFYLIQWLIYPNVWKMPLVYLPMFLKWVEYGRTLKRDLTKMSVKEIKQMKLSEARKHFGIFKNDFIGIVKHEVFTYGVNNRLIDGLEVSTVDILKLEEMADEIYLYSYDLEKDLTVNTIISTVRQNLKKGKFYTYIIADTEKNKKHKEELLNLHSNNPNLKVVMYDEDFYVSRYGKEHDTVMYDDILSSQQLNDNAFKITVNTEF